jgi:AraC-like DNA-binding protein
LQNPIGISKIEDDGGSNFIIQSNLSNYYGKTIADKFSIKVVQSGIEHYRIDGINYTLADENFIIVCPGQEVAVHIDSPSAVKGTCYYLSTDLIHQMRYAYSASIEANLKNIEPKDDFTIDQLYNFPIHSFHTPLNNHLHSHSFQALNKHQLKEYLILLAENMVFHQHHSKRQLNNLEGVGMATKNELYKRLQIGRQYIHDHFDQPITLKEMSRAAALSEYYFHRNFRLFFNQTPYQYHNAVRMVKAENLLQRGHLSKIEIALMCGFQDPKYFAKAYKKWKALKR